MLVYALIHLLYLASNSEDGQIVEEKSVVQGALYRYPAWSVHLVLIYRESKKKSHVSILPEGVFEQSLTSVQ